MCISRQQLGEEDAARGVRRSEGGRTMRSRERRKARLVHCLSGWAITRSTAVRDIHFVDPNGCNDGRQQEMGGVS